MRTVQCVKLGRELPDSTTRQSRVSWAAYFRQCSVQAWEMWREQATILINHYGLTMADPRPRVHDDADGVPSLAKKLPCQKGGRHRHRLPKASARNKDAAFPVHIKIATDSPHILGAFAMYLARHSRQEADALYRRNDHGLTGD